MYRAIAFVLAAAYVLVPAGTRAQQPTPAQAQSPKTETFKTEIPKTETQWLRDKKGCKVANPSPKPKEAVTWSGACVDGLMHGKGVLHFISEGKPGARYEGTLERGRMTGRGALTTPDGASYEGDWVGGKQDGYGKYKGADGSTYEGGWTAGQPDGPGVYRSPKGEVVRGVWENGKLVIRYKDRFSDK
jgi:hypothetical protein